MLKRVREIKHVGSFRNFSNGGSVQFEKMTFVYGLNTRGKTTIADIFNSYKEGNSAFITDRKSIPDSGHQQSLKFSIKLDEQNGEYGCEFVNGNWSNRTYSDRFYIFGSEFIHKNLFTGLSVERQNKENLTQFILGEAGVELANQIARDKRELRQKRTSLSTQVPQYVRGKGQDEIQAYLELEVDHLDKDVLQKDVVDLKASLIVEEQRLEKPSEILAIRDVSEISIPLNVVEKLAERSLAVLSREYTDISESALRQIQAHIEENFTEEENAESWIREGLDSIKNDPGKCNFCGQSLTNATELIRAYHDYFNVAYRDYTSEINDDISLLIKDWSGQKYDVVDSLNSTKILLQQYRQLIKSEIFDDLVAEFTQAVESIPEIHLNDLITTIGRDITEFLEAKKKIPHERITPPNLDELQDTNSRYFHKIKELSLVVGKIRASISEFKEGYRDLREIRTRIEEIKADIYKNERYLARIEQNTECEFYLGCVEEIEGLQQRIEESEEVLRNDQSVYLENFYDKINSHFERFGSENFTLERGTNNRGHQPVYFLKVKFQGVYFDEGSIGKVLSESDKRALALAIFWAKIDLLDAESKSNAIIVLDDPVTSFDDNRIDMSINLFKETLRLVRQIIILTHYPHFIRSFCERSMNDDFTTAFIEIVKNNNTSSLRRTDKNAFLETIYESKFNKIQAFISRESTEDIKSDLRPFLESQYLPHFYIEKLQQAEKDGLPVNTLSEKIDAIFIDNEEAKIKFHSFRTHLNPDSHLFTSSNEESVRSFARDMMSYLYNFNYSTSS